METIDFVLLAPLLLGAFLGYKRGFTVTIFKFVGILLGLILAFKLMDWGVRWLMPFVGSDHDWLPVLSFILIFIGVVILVNLAGQALKKFLDIILLGMMDNVFGAIFNALKWAFFMGVILILAKRMEIEALNEPVQRSVVAEYMISFSSSLLDFISWIAPTVREFIYTATQS